MDSSHKKNSTDLATDPYYKKEFLQTIYWAWHADKQHQIVLSSCLAGHVFCHIVCRAVGHQGKNRSKFSHSSADQIVKKTLIRNCAHDQALHYVASSVFQMINDRLEVTSLFILRTDEPRDEPTTFNHVWFNNINI